MPPGPPWPPPGAPEGHRADVVLVPLTRALVDLDVAALAASPAAVAAHSAGRWPAHLTREQDLVLLAQHEAEHAAGEAFAYALLDRGQRRELGCAYLRPLAAYLTRTGTVLAAPPDAAVLTFWLLDDVDARPGATAVLAELGIWVDRWAAAPVVLRLLPEEHESLLAATALGLAEVAALAQPLPYRWCRLPGGGA